MSAARSRRANDKHNHLQRTPILVMGCSLLIACCIAFGGTNWTASAQPSEDQLPEQNAIVEPGYYPRSTMAQNSSRMLSSSLLPTSYSSTTAANPLLICVRLKTTRAMLLQLLRQARQQPNLLRLHSLLHLPLTQTAFLTRMLYSSTSSLARH